MNRKVLDGEQLLVFALHLVAEVRLGAFEDKQRLMCVFIFFSSCDTGMEGHFGFRYIHRVSDKSGRNVVGRGRDGALRTFNRGSSSNVARR